MGWSIITGPEAGHWVADRIEGGYFAERSEAIGLKRNGELVAGVIYEHFNHRSIWAHIAAEGRMTPAYLAAIFDYPFEVADVDKVICPVGSDNVKATKLVKKMGFTEEARIRDARPAGDIVIYTLCRGDCRFLGRRYKERLRHGQEFPSTAAASP